MPKRSSISMRSSENSTQRTKGGVPDDVTEVPSKYENIQIYSVVVGWTHAGAEGQGLSIENGVHRDFRYSDMLDYIHNNVLPFARVGAVT